MVSITKVTRPLHYYTQNEHLVENLKKNREIKCFFLNLEKSRAQKESHV